MARIDQLINEIKELRKESNHRSVLRIYNLLENNKKLFLEKMDAGTFNLILGNFENLSQVASKEYNTTGYVRSYENYFESLLFYLNRII